MGGEGGERPEDSRPGVDFRSSQQDANQQTVQARRTDRPDTTEATRYNRQEMEIFVAKRATGESREKSEQMRKVSKGKGIQSTQMAALREAAGREAGASQFMQCMYVQWSLLYVVCQMCKDLLSRRRCD